MPWRENKGVANLDGIYTDGLGLPVGKKSLRKSLFRCCFARNEIPMKYNLKTKSLTKMRNSTLLCWRDLMGIALQARHPNENL